MARPRTPVPVPALAGGAAVAYLAARAWRTEAARFARMSGSSIAAPDAAGWVTDFLNAAYFRRRPELRELDDLRLAFAVLTTRWHRREHRRLRAHDVLAFHRAFGRDRFLDRERAPRGTLDRRALLEGAERLLGEWFPGAYADPGRRAYGIAFETAAERASYAPEVRLRDGGLGALTPGRAAPERQTWHAYAPVDAPDAGRVLDGLLAVERWPDYATEIGRFTPVASGGLEDQVFEIEVAAGTDRGAPVYTRGYVTVTRLLTAAQRPAELEAWVAALNDGLARHGEDEPAAVAPGATPVAALELTTHEGHFMGRGMNRLVLYEEDGQARLRAAGTWDPMPRHLRQAYELAGREAQPAFWGEGEARRSMLHQIALAAR